MVFSRPPPPSYQHISPVDHRAPPVSLVFSAHRHHLGRREVTPNSCGGSIKTPTLLGGSINGGTPFMVGFFHGKTIYKWMRTGGAPILGNLHICLKSHHFMGMET